MFIKDVPSVMKILIRKKVIKDIKKYVVFLIDLNSRFVTSFFPGVMDHLANVHSERVQCELCDFQGFPAFQLTIHQTLTHKKCNKCEFRFNTTDELQDHMNKSHGKF